MNIEVALENTVQYTTSNFVDITDQSKKEVEKVKSLLNLDTLDALIEAEAVLAGGALTSIFTRKDVNDFDIYFKNKEGFQFLIQEIFNTDVCTGNMSTYNLQVNFATNRSILCRESNTNNDVQLVVYKMFPTVEDIFKAFDFTINMCAYDFKSGRMYAHTDFVKHCSQRYISFNDATHYPIVSALRVQKYVERGYYIPKSEMLRILFTIADRSYDSWEKVKSEVVGMYGIPIDEVFDETKPFNLKEVVEQLHNCLKVDNSVLSVDSVSEQDLVKKFPNLLDKEWIDKQGFWWNDIDSIF